MFDVLIPVGGCCLTSFVTHKYGYSTGNSPYSWISIPDFSDVVNTIPGFPDEIVETPEKYTGTIQPNYVGTNIWLSHSDPERIKRRYERMIETIKSDKNILFLRVNHRSDNMADTSLLDSFDQKLREINPDIKYKIVVVNEYTEEDNIIILEHPHLIYFYIVGKSINPGTKYEQILRCDFSDNQQTWDFLEKLVPVKIPDKLFSTSSN